MATMLGGATPRTLCLIDEFGKGTNAQDCSGLWVSRWWFSLVSKQGSRLHTLSRKLRVRSLSIPTLLTCVLTQDGISLLYACLQHFLDRQAKCPKVLGRLG